MARLTTLRVVSGARELARAAAAEFVRSVGESVREHGRAAVALAGGSTPRELYRLLASLGEPFRERLPWERIHFFWGDERHVPPDHPDSNFRMAREAMFDAAPVPAANLHRIRSEDPDAAAAAADYEMELRRSFGLAAGEVPRFDLMLLGLGADGHTASLFPGSPAVSETRRLVAAPWIEELQDFRITLTPPVFNRAARVLFLVSGAEKAAALRAVCEGERDVERYPAQVVQPVSGNLSWLVDREAAALLSRAG